MFCLQGNTIITGCGDSAVRVIDSTNFNILFSLHGHSGSVDHMTLVGKVLVTAATDRWVSEIMLFVYNLIKLNC